MAISVGDLLSNLLLNVSDFTNNLRQAGNDAESETSKISGGFAGLGDTFKQVGNALTNVGIAATLWEIGKSSMDAYTEIAKLQSAMQAVLPPGESAVDMMGRLRDITQHSNFDLPELATAANRMLTMGITTHDTSALMQGLVDTAAGLGKGQEFIDAGAAAMARLAQQGIVTNQTMKQFLNEGIPAWDILAEKLHTKVGPAQEMVKKGAVDANTAMQAFMDYYSTYAGAAEAKTQTFAGAWGQVKKAVGEASEALGKDIRGVMDQLAPVLLMVANGIRDLIEWWKGLPGPVREAIAIFGGLVTGLTAVAAITSAVIAVWPVLVAAFGVATGPIGLAIVAVSAIIAVLIELGKWVHDNIEPIKAVLTQAWDGIKETWAYVWDGIKAVFTAFWDWLSNIPGVKQVIQFFEKVWDNISSAWSGAWNTISGWFGGVWNSLKGSSNEVVSYYSTVWSAIKDAWHGDWSGIGKVISDAWTYIQSNPTIKAAIDYFTFIWQAIKQAWQGDWSGIGQVISDAWAAFKDLTGITATVEWFQNIWDKISDAWDTAWQRIGKVLSDFWNWLKNLPGVSAVIDFFSNVWDNISDLWANAWDYIVSWFEGLWDSFLSIPGVSAVVDWFSGIWDDISDWWSRTWDSIVSWFEGLWDDFTSLPAVRAVIDFFTTIWDKISTWWSETWDGIVSWFQNAWNNIIQAGQGVVNWLDQALGGALTWIGEKVLAFITGISGLAEAFAKWIPGLGDASSKLQNLGQTWDTANANAALQKQAVNDVNNALTDYNKKLGDHKTTLEGVGTSHTKVTQSLNELQQAFKDAGIKTAESFDLQLDKMGKAIDVAQKWSDAGKGSAENVQIAIDAASAAILKHAETMDGLKAAYSSGQLTMQQYYDQLFTNLENEVAKQQAALDAGKGSMGLLQAAVQALTQAHTEYDAAMLKSFDSTIKTTEAQDKQIDTLAQMTVKAQEYADTGVRSYQDVAIAQQQLTDAIVKQAETMDTQLSAAYKQGKIDADTYFATVEANLALRIQEWRDYGDGSQENLNKIAAGEAALAQIAEESADKIAKAHEAAFSKLGVLSTEGYNKVVADSEAAYQKILNDSTATYDQIVAAHAHMLQQQYDAAVKSGQDISNAQLAELANVQAANQAHLDQVKNQYLEAYNSMKDTVKGFFDTLTSNLLQGKVSWSDFKDAVVGAAQDMAKAMIEGFLGKMEEKAASWVAGAGMQLLENLTGVGTTATTAIGSLTSVGTQAISATGNLADLTAGSKNLQTIFGQASGEINSALNSMGSTATSTASSIAGMGAGLMTQFTGIAGAVGSVVSAIASIGLFIQGMHEQKVQGEIETNTRITYTELQNLRQQLYEMEERQSNYDLLVKMDYSNASFDRLNTSMDDQTSKVQYLVASFDRINTSMDKSYDMLAYKLDYIWNTMVAMSQGQLDVVALAQQMTAPVEQTAAATQETVTQVASAQANLDAINSQTADASAQLEPIAQATSGTETNTSDLAGQAALTQAAIDGATQQAAIDAGAMQAAINDAAAQAAANAGAQQAALDAANSNLMNLQAVTDARIMELKDAQVAYQIALDDVARASQQGADNVALLQAVADQRLADVHAAELDVKSATDAVKEATAGTQASVDATIPKFDEIATATGGTTEGISVLTDVTGSGLTDVTGATQETSASVDNLAAVSDASWNTLSGATKALGDQMFNMATILFQQMDNIGARDTAQVVAKLSESIDHMIVFDGDMRMAMDALSANIGAHLDTSANMVIGGIDNLNGTAGRIADYTGQMARSYPNINISVNASGVGVNEAANMISGQIMSQLQAQLVH